jgi:hypothetical protein
MTEQHAEREQRFTPLELLFDLVFVFGFTQMTTVRSDDPTWSGLGHGLLILAAFWWAVVLPALVALTLVAVVWVALHAYQFIWWREARARTRELRVPAVS